MKRVTVRDLQSELSSLRASFEANGRSMTDSTRMDAIRKDLRRRLVAQARHEILFDMNGHHGAA